MLTGSRSAHVRSWQKAMNIDPNKAFSQADMLEYLALLQRESKLNSAGVCFGLCLEKARHHLKYQSDDYDGVKFAQRLRRKVFNALRYNLKNDGIGTNLDKRIQQYQGELQDYQRSQSQEFSRNQDIDSLFSLDSEALIIGIEMKEGGHAVMLRRELVDGKYQYYFFEPNYGETFARDKKGMQRLISGYLDLDVNPMLKSPDGEYFSATQFLTKIGIEPRGTKKFTHHIYKKSNEDFIEQISGLSPDAIFTKLITEREPISGKTRIEIYLDSTMGFVLTDLIKRCKINVNSKDKSGKSFLHMFAEKGDVYGIGKLLLIGVDVNSKDAEGNTALHIAASNLENGNLILEKLLTKNASLNITNNKGKSALAIAIEVRNRDFINALVQCESLELDESAKKALLKNHDREIAKILEERLGHVEELHKSSHAQKILAEANPPNSSEKTRG